MDVRGWTGPNGRTSRELVRFATAVLLAALLVGEGGCLTEDRGGDFFTVLMEVRDAQSMPVADALVTPYIVDVDHPGETRQPIALETRLTDASGLVSWEYEALHRPYICGYEIRDATGALTLLAATPDVDRPMSNDEGFLSVTLP